MKSKRALALLMVWLASCAALPTLGQTPGFASVYAFSTPTALDSTNADGANPFTGVTSGSDGNLYGTTYYGGDYSFGTVFKVTPNGVLTTLHSFLPPETNGGHYGPLLQASDGYIYGTTSDGGVHQNGTLYRVDPVSGAYATLCEFPDPIGTTFAHQSSLLQARDGNLYLTGISGHTGWGSIYRVTLGGQVTEIFQFTYDNATGQSADGCFPFAGLIQGQGSDNNLYGTTGAGGPSEGGVVYRIALDGSGFTVLHAFTGQATDGATPFAKLTQAQDGSLYGTTYGGGLSGAGAVYRIGPDGSGFAVVHSFTDITTGANPLTGVAEGPDGNIYGTAQGGEFGNGLVYRLTPGGVFTLIHTFASMNPVTFANPDGALPYGDLIRAADGTIYGTASAGGSTSTGEAVLGGYGNGTVFKLVFAAPTKPPAPANPPPPTNPPPPANPQQLIQALIAEIDAAVSANTLTQGTGTALKATLQAAIQQINAGNNTAAKNQMGAFVNKVQALVKSRRLSASQGQSWINSAESIIGML